VFVAPARAARWNPSSCLAAGTEPAWTFALLAAVTGRIGDPARHRARGAGADRLLDRRDPAARHPAPVARGDATPTSARYPEIWAAAGRDRSVFPISPAALRAATSATVAEIAEIAPDVPRAGSRCRGSRHPGVAPGRPAAPGRDHRAKAGRRRLPGRNQGPLPVGRSGGGDAVFALSEAGGELFEYGTAPGRVRTAMPRRAAHRGSCRGLGLPVGSPHRSSTPRPAGLGQRPGLLVVKYGFVTYGLAARTGALRWSHRSGSPVSRSLGSAAPAHVLVQAEIETFALEEDGEVRWRVGHSDVVAECELIGGRLVLTSYAGLVSALDPATGHALRDQPSGAWTRCGQPAPRTRRIVERTG